MIIHEMPQGSAEWFTIRTGKFTASLDFQQLVTGKSDTQKKLFRKKAAERITGQLVQSEYTNANMERGKDLEDEAIKAFEMKYGIAVRRVGFCEMSDWVGSSPDGLIGDDCGIEIKARDIHTHLDCFLDGYDRSYKWQIQGNLWVTGRQTWYFVSYNPFYATIDKSLFVEKIERDEALISQIEMGVNRGIEAVKKILPIFAAETI